MKRLITIFCLAVFMLSLVAANSVVYAQDETDRVAVIWYVDAKDGMEDEFEDAVKAFHNFMADKEGHWRWEWTSVLTGENTGQYRARSGDHNWADMDVEYAWEDEVDAYFEKNVPTP